MIVGKLCQLLREEFTLDWRALTGRILTAPLPRGSASRLRARLLGLAGLTIGERSLIMSRLVVIGGKGSWRNVQMGAGCFVNEDCVFDATAPIVIGNDVNLGHGVLI